MRGIDAGADVDFRERMRGAYSAADGTFAISLLEPGSYTLRAPDGNQPVEPPRRCPHGRVVVADLVLDAGAARHLELRLPPEGRIAGVVVDALGTPRAQARIGAIDERGSELSAFGWEAVSDSSGAFELDSIAPGTYALFVRSNDARSTHSPLEVEAGRTATARLVVP